MESPSSAPSASKIRRNLIRCAIIVFLLLVGIGAAGFPRDVDTPLGEAEVEKSRAFYADAYKKGAPAEEQTASDYDTKYLEIATAAANEQHINDKVAAFASQYGLRDGSVLDIGSGRGYLQDVVGNYTGLDISSSVERFYHKKFVLGSATAMPFPDNSFDGGWSIWVFEHVPNPEQGFSELRRVMKNNAVFFLMPAWNCNSWAAQGYDARPYSDFDLRGKLIKASVPVRETVVFKAFSRFPERVLRDSASRFGPTRLHYQRLEPNYKDYWEPDSDAVNSLDEYEVMLWFLSRGDECLNCDSRMHALFSRGSPLILRIHKS